MVSLSTQKCVLSKEKSNKKEKGSNSSILYKLIEYKSKGHCSMGRLIAQQSKFYFICPTGTSNVQQFEMHPRQL